MKPEPYSFVGPDGMRHEGENLRAFCRKHSLDIRNLYRVLDGVRRHHKGFTSPEAMYVRTYNSNIRG